DGRVRARARRCDGGRRHALCARRLRRGGLANRRSRGEGEHVGVRVRARNVGTQGSRPARVAARRLAESERGGSGAPGPARAVIAPGSSAPLGATYAHDGVNFSLFSRHATGVTLLLFDGVDDARPSRVIRLEPGAHRTYFYWHVLVPGVRSGQLYGYRVEGPFRPESGLRFDPTKVLLDPYGRGVVVPTRYSRAAAKSGGDNAATAMKSVVVNCDDYDWEGDAPLRRPSGHTIVYEMHVRGFTRHPSSGVSEKTRGTFAGLVEKIPYLRDLGITAVELLPVFQFDAQDSPPR